MDKKEIVYFGDPNSVYNINLMKEMEKKGYKVSCYSVANEIEKIYEQGKKIKLFRKIKKFFLCKKFFAKFDKSCIAHIQFISFDNLFYLPFFIRRFKFFVLSFWGSDLLRQSRLRLNLMLPLFFFSKNITVETEEMKRIFVSKVPFFYKSKKICYARFGLSELNIIDNIDNASIKKFREKYKIDGNKKIVIVGYNKRKEQQHMSVVNSLSNSLNEQIQLVFPWTYGETSFDYENQLKELLDRKKIPYIFIKDYLTDKEIGCLRLITDIFIQVQTTDSLSACMLETLYSKKIVITGKWLPYSFLDEKGIEMIKVMDPHEVGEKISFLIHNKDNFNLINNRNSQIVASFCQWSNCIEDWLLLY